MKNNLTETEYKNKVYKNIYEVTYEISVNKRILGYLDLYDIVSALILRAEGYRNFAETDIGTIIAKKHMLSPSVSFGNGGFGPVGKVLPNSLTHNIVKGSNKELSPHTEALIDNIKETLENIQYGIKQPEQSEEVKNFKGNKDVIKNKEHFKGYFNKLGMSIR